MLKEHLQLCNPNHTKLCVVVLGMVTTALCMLGNHLTFDLYPQAMKPLYLTALVKTE